MAQQERTLQIEAPKTTKLVNAFARNYTHLLEPSGPIRTTLHEQYMLNGAQQNGEAAEEWVGTTYYDLQTNGSHCNRIIATPDCDISMVWTGHPSTADGNFPNRGTFYQNTEDCSPFGGQPMERIESDSRTGWPNIVQLGDGTKVVINHTFASSNQVLLVRETSPGVWEEGATVPSTASLGFLWPRAVAVGQTIHLIGVTGPGAATAPVYEPTFEGLTQALVYYRSDDGGQTWAIQEHIIPGTTSAETLGYNADVYSLAADEDGNVAIALFPLTDDVILLKSDQNGDIGSWTKRIVHDFPLFKFELGNQSYTVEDIGGVAPRGPGSRDDADGTDSLALSTSDGSGSVALDANGMAHVSYSEMYIYSDSTLQEGFLNRYFFPLGMAYWNESFEDDNPAYITAVEDGLDVDRSGVYDFDNADAIYTNGISSLITSSNINVTDDGEIIITYSQAMENLLSENVDQPQHYAQVHVTASEDGGTTWACPYNVINEDLALFGLLVPMTDAIFPHSTIIESDHLAIWYQFDDEPGLNLDADEGDPINASTISEVSIRVNEYLDTSMGCSEEVSVEEVASPETFGMRLSPNPASDVTRLEYELSEGADLIITVKSVTGQKMMNDELSQSGAGKYQYPLNTSGLAPGIYLVSLTVGDKIATQRLVIGK